MGDDGKDDCRVTFLAKEYAVGERGLGLNGAIVRIVAVYLSDNENRSARRLYHHSRGYAVSKVVTPHNNTCSDYCFKIRNNNIIYILNRIELTFWTGVDLATISLELKGTHALVESNWSTWKTVFLQHL
jgi:hypothetical protein